jgi:hypothetical protein
VCKVHGITLNYKASQLINFNDIRDMILKGEPGTVNVHTERKVKQKRRADGGGACVSLITEPEDKLYRISFFK